VTEADEKVVRATFADWNSGNRDPSQMLIHPEVEVHSALAQTVYRGLDGVVEWSREIDDQFEDWTVRIEDLRDLGDGRFVVEGSIHGRGRNSGVNLDQPASWLADVRDGRLIRLVNFIGLDSAADSLEEDR
jgi:ketosteroid isomerase-like protein